MKIKNNTIIRKHRRTISFYPNDFLYVFNSENSKKNIINNKKEKLNKEFLIEEIENKKLKNAIKNTNKNKLNKKIIIECLNDINVNNKPNLSIKGNFDYKSLKKDNNQNFLNKIDEEELEYSEKSIIKTKVNNVKKNNNKYLRQSLKKYKILDYRTFKFKNKNTNSTKIILKNKKESINKMRNLIKNNFLKKYNYL